MAKMAVFALLESSKWISRKIWVIQKSWNFHTVYYCKYDRTAKHVVRPTPKGSGIATERSAEPPEKGENLGHIFVVKLAKSLVSNVL